MEVVRQVVKLESEGYRYIIRNKHPSHKLSNFIQLFVIAQQDFPNLKPADVEVVCYEGEFSHRSFGIEWDSHDTPKEWWKITKNVEYVL